MAKHAETAGEDAVPTSPSISTPAGGHMCARLQGYIRSQATIFLLTAETDSPEINRFTEQNRNFAHRPTYQP